MLTDGGNNLGTSRDKPYLMQMGGKTLDMTSDIPDTYQRHHLDALVCLGGGGTQKNASESQSERNEISAKVDVFHNHHIDDTVRLTALLEERPARKRGVMIDVHGNKLEPAPIEDTADKKNLVPLDHSWIQSARYAGTCLGDG
jgi:hypothetical protein